MAKRFRKNRPPERMRWFFWEGKLHRTTHIDKPKNILTATCIPEDKTVQFVYSHIRVHRERAFRQAEVCKLLGRSSASLDKIVLNGEIPKPYKVTFESGYFGIRFWRAKEIYAAHEYYINLPRARSDLPNRMQLTAMMEEGVSYIIEDEEGNRTRAFKENMW